MDYWIISTLALLFGLLAAYLLLKYIDLKGRTESRAREMFETWQAREMDRQVSEKAETLFRTWKLDEEKKIRQDAVKKSEAVTRGKVTEHLIPYFPDFEYNPKDARFLGTPVDFIVFDGLSEGKMNRVVFVEVKTGKTGALSPREKLVRDCIGRGKVSYEIIHNRDNN
ncbi:MAG: Holliday junction resolvase-like protein [Methanosarcina flavescens]|uniref:Holliday junction resolvase n=1 Tax=Methanosarcina flavescens TaxID=1715806 RepID=A0A660HVM1_9EURY|nr:Holliday junction resolvase-like protein [Methanosarcina flavescens]AYK16176.1 Holliday junction resolvase [Methanosarcina flavescens]NLK31741.1 Holliday junction resolvase [Methanosarcina flavescens]